MNRVLLLGILLVVLSGCGPVAARGGAERSAPEPAPTADLPDLGPAPELTNKVWLNVEAPLRLADLRGKVVAIDMWTFG